MNTAFALMARFESPTVELKAICDEFFGYTKNTAEQKAKACDLPVPTFKLRNSERAPTLVNITDLADYMDKCRQEAKQEWDLIQQAKC